MFKITISLLLLSVFTFNAHASSLPPQETSTGADGIFNLLSDDVLFNNADGIYNFIDFNIADGVTLNINNSGPVYIYSQQSITIFGNLFANTTDLHLIAPTFNSGETSTISASSLTFTILDSAANDDGLGNADTGNGITIGSGNPGITPVPVPAAIWLMLSGILILFRFKAK